MKDFIIKLVIIVIVAFFAWKGYEAFNKGRTATSATREQSGQAEEMLER